jgi:hypothetical protein
MKHATAGVRTTEPVDRLPPHSPEAERGVLGCILLSPNECMLECIERLKAGKEAFYDLRHQSIFNALADLYEEQEAIDVITLQQRLRDWHLLEEAGGIAYISALPDTVPSAANLSYYLDIVQEKFLRRKVIRMCTNAVGQAYDYGGETDSLLDQLTSDVTRLRDGADGEIVAHPWIDVGQAARDADILIGPGRWITRGAGVLLVGYTGTGKSTWTATQSFSWAIGRESLGMRPNGPLKSLVFQAEDDAGDLDAMARSIVTELAPNEAERDQIRQNVLVITETTATGIEFLTRKVAPGLRRYRPDLLWLNPISAFFGGDLNDQREVAQFFRNGLNPLLMEYRCACFGVHHCPKPTRERNEWTGGLLAYAGAGSADIANWAREVITLRETSRGLFEMSLAKRWRKIGWTDSENRPTATRLIAHDRKGGQVWHDATADILADLGATPYSDAALVALVPDAGIDHAELVRRVADSFSVTERTAKKFVSDARRVRRRNVNGKPEGFALLDETTKPRRDIYPDKPQGRAVVWLTKAVREKS